MAVPVILQSRRTECGLAAITMIANHFGHDLDLTAGAGVVHSEMPSERIRDEGGRVHGFQIWVNLPKASKMKDPRYQEAVQAEGMPLPVYQVVTEEGPDHDKVFHVEVGVGELFAHGHGRTKKRAEQRAARQILEALRHRESHAG